MTGAHPGPGAPTPGRRRHQAGLTYCQSLCREAGEALPEGRAGTALSNAGHQTPQDLADYLARWTEPGVLNTASNK